MARKAIRKPLGGEREVKFTETQRTTAWDALARFNEMRDQLTHFARSITKNKKVNVRATNETPHTKGGDIFIRPPLSLGKDYTHSRLYCGRRGSDGRQICLACRAREIVNFYLFHEIGHIWGGTFEVATSVSRDLAKAFVDEWHPVDAKCEHRMPMLNNIDIAGNLADLSGVLEKLIFTTYNAFEDSRVNEAMFQARPGLRRIFDVNIERIMSEGIQDDTGVHKTWRDAPLNSQFLVGACCIASGYTVTGWFADEVMEALDDERVRDICASVALSSRTARDTFEASLDLFRRAQELGFCVVPKCAPVPSMPNEETEPGDGTPSDKEGEDGSGNPEGVEGSSGANESGGSPEDTEGEDGPGGGDGPEAPGVPGESPEGSDDAPAGTEPGDLSPPSEADEAMRDDREGDGSEESLDSGEGDEGGPDRPGPDSDTGIADGDKLDDSETGDAGPGYGHDDEDLEDDEHDADPSPLSIASGEPDEVSTESEEKLGFDRELVEGMLDEISEAVDGMTAGDPEPLPMGDADDVMKALAPILMHGMGDDAGFLEGMGGEELLGVLVDVLADGDETLDVEKLGELLAIAIEQSLYFDAPSVNVAGVDEVKFPERRIGWMPGSSVDQSRDWRSYIPSEGLLSKAVLHARLAFEANKRARLLPNLKSGRVNTRKLYKAALGDEKVFGKRIVPKKKSYHVIITGDCSGSTSAGLRNAKIKRAMMAQAEILNRIGIPFSMFGHSGSKERATSTGGKRMPISEESSFWLYMLQIKGETEPWNQATKERLACMPPVAANLDGHTLEYVRKLADRAKVTATDVIIIYYSDGSMPLENYREEYEILQREMKKCKDSGYTLLCVGIDTDEPAKYGLNTVRVNSDDDLMKVIKQLEQELTS